VLADDHRLVPTSDLAGRLGSPVVTAGDSEQKPAFPSGFDNEFPVGPLDGNSAFFGRDVLRGLIAGIDDFIAKKQPRWEQFRSVGPVLLGSAMWINDGELIEKLAQLAGASIVVSKQPRNSRQLKRLQKLNERTPGLPIEAFAELADLAMKVEGEPVAIGPYDRLSDEVVPTIRTIGYRRVESQIPVPPIMHAKLALLGHLIWHDEDDLGNVAEIIYFKPRRLWFSSATFTRSSRLSLEVGFWTEEDALVQGAERFLTSAMRYSEALDPDSDVFDPDFAPVGFDDAAFREVIGEVSWAEDEPYDDPY
jgi:hypothetical protein